MQTNKQNIIFLDFDGVMDTALQLPMVGDARKEERKEIKTDKYGILFDEEPVKNLGKIIAATHADIVIHSSWKIGMSVEYLQEMWKVRELPGNVIGKTPDINFYVDDEIEAWLEEHEAEVGKYVIIDDMPADFFTPHFAKHLFSVNPNVGLDAETTDKIIQYLGYSS